MYPHQLSVAEAHFTLLLPVTCFCSIYSSHFQAEILFTSECDICSWQYYCVLWDLASHI